MGLRTPKQYLDGLVDDREVYYRGERVPNVLKHPELGVAARHASIDYEMSEDPAYRKIAVFEEKGELFSKYFQIPKDAQDLLDRSRLIETGTTLGATLVLLIKEIGTDALLALMRVLSRHGDAKGLERVKAFHKRCKDGDLSLAVAQTDVKGDRSKKPSDQSDPDLFLHIVKKNADGIFVRGAKVHTSCTPYIDEIIVLPAKSMSSAEGAWSVAFAVPANTPGVKMYASDFLHGTDDAFSKPISTTHKMVETLTVFEDVFVPWDRVFFAEAPEIASATALTFVEFHRFTAVSYKLPLLDTFVGAGIAVAQANGIEKAGHVREKLTWLSGYAETVRGLTQLAAMRCETEAGIAFPHVFTTNLAKWTFARDFHRAMEVIQDLAGGLLCTGPSGADWDSPEVRPVLEKYFVGAWPAAKRLAMINLISELTARPYGGYQAVLAIHAEGSIEAEKMAMYRAYNYKPALNLALKLASLDGKPAERKVSTKATEEAEVLRAVSSD